jgi:CubicO group peptidase (beta-lactamase class C family)
VAAATQPVRFPADPGGTALVRAAFAQVAGAAARPGETLEDFLGRTRTTSLLVLRDGVLLYEGYFTGHRRDTVQPSFSMAKSVLALLVGMAIAEHRLPPVEAPAEGLLPTVVALRGSGVSVRDLMTMTSGFALTKGPLPWPFDIPWDDRRLMYFAPDLRAVAASVRPEHPPGTRFLYDDRNAILVGMALTGVIGEPAAAWLARRLWQPMGAEFAASWAVDSPADDFEKMESGINARPIDFLKLGQLVLRGGVTESGERLLRTDWIEAIATATPRLPGWSDGDDMSYGLFWWGLARAGGPPDVLARGSFGQVLLVSRVNGGVVLRTGDAEGGIASWPRLLRDLADAIGPAPR